MCNTGSKRVDIGVLLVPKGADGNREARKAVIAKVASAFSPAVVLVSSGWLIKNRTNKHFHNIPRLAVSGSAVSNVA